METYYDNNPMKHTTMPAIEYHGDRPCLHPAAYPVLYSLAANNPATPPKRGFVAVLRAIFNPTNNHTTNNNNH